MQTRNIETTLASATLCGCVVQLTTVVGSSHDDGDFDTRLSAGPTAILSQCEAHQHLDTPVDLYEELKHFHGTKYSPDTCGCALYYWWDDREPEADRAHTSAEHTRHTRRCAIHAFVADTIEHYDAVLAHNTVARAET